MDSLSNALSGEKDILKQYGILFNKKTLIKNIGFKYYVCFWHRRFYIAKAILDLIEKTERDLRN